MSHSAPKIEENDDMEEVEDNEEDDKIRNRQLQMNIFKSNATGDLEELCKRSILSNSGIAPPTLTP